MSQTLPLLLAGLMGAAGVVLAALAAHAAPGAGLDSASNMLLFHAVAVLAAISLIAGGRLAPLPASIATAGWIIGALLFAGDIALRAWTGHRLFPMAAPTGGTILILSWLVLAISALVARKA